MYLRKCINKKTGRTQLSIVQGYRRNFGYAALSSIYHVLEINSFFQNRQRMTKAQFNYNSFFRSLVFARLIAPASKRASFSYLKHFFERTDFSLDDVYRSLSLKNTRRISSCGSMSIPARITAGIPPLFIMMSPTITLRLMNPMKCCAGKFPRNTAKTRSYRWGYLWIPTASRFPMAFFPAIPWISRP